MVNVINTQDFDRLNDNDIIICKNGKWVVVSKEDFLKEYTLEILKLKVENESLTKSINDIVKEFGEFKTNINEKLEKHHNVLKILVKEN